MASSLEQNNPPSPLQTKGQAYSQDIHEKTNTDEITDLVDLSVCSSVVYEERGSVPGVKFVNKDQLEEVRTPVVKGNEKKPVSKGDGTRNNPVRAGDEKLRLTFAKDIGFMELDGSPGLRFRNRKMNHNYQWMPIAANSPVSLITRLS